MSDCNHDCGSCAEKCGKATDMREKTHELSNIKKVFAIVSGKGGVGKSSVTGLLASAMSKNGKTVAVLDADITGPSVPKMFGVRGTVDGDGSGMYPKVSQGGVKIISANLLLPSESDPVVWRGPLIAGMVRQFWTDVVWGDVDYMFVDCPPGTGDVPLTVFQSFKIDGIIIVTSPQELVSMIVGKAVKMARMMNIPIVGVIENLSYVECPDCGKLIYPFGEGRVDEVATEYHLKVLARMPIDAAIAKACDNGAVESLSPDYLATAIAELTAR